MQSRIEQDIAACRALWERFSPKRALCDLWEFRFPFYEVFGFTPAFVVTGAPGSETGLLPLWHQKEQGRYLWFGDLGDECDWQEDAEFWGDPQALLAAAPKPLRLTCLTENAASLVTGAKEMEPKCVLPLQGYSSSEDYLMSIPKKLRSNLRGDRNRMQALQIRIVRDRFEDFSVLLSMNTSAFEDSPFHDAKTVAVFKKIIASGSGEAPFRTHMLTAEIEGVIGAVDCMFLYQQTAYSMLCGSDTRRFSGIGNAMQLMDIDEAITLGMRTIDFAEADFDAPKLKLFPSRKQYVFEA